MNLSPEIFSVTIHEDLDNGEYVAQTAYGNGGVSRVIETDKDLAELWKAIYGWYMMQRTKYL